MALPPTPLQQNATPPAGSLILEAAMLQSTVSGKVINLKPLVYEINIYEDITQNFVVADIVLADALALTSIMPIVGHETVSLSLKTPLQTITKSASGSFRVISVEDFWNNNLRTAQYIIHCASQEYLTNLRTKVMKAYDNKPIVDMVKDIAETNLGIQGSSLKASATDGMRTIVIPNLQPTVAIAFLCREAQAPSQSLASNYMFYQNLDGFHFKTMEELIQQDPKDTYYASEKHLEDMEDKRAKAYDPLSSINPPDDDDDEEGGDADPSTNPVPVIPGAPGTPSNTAKPGDLMKIYSFKFKNLFSLDKTLVMGGFEAKLHYIDPIYSLNETVNYDYIQDFDKLSHLYNRNSSGNTNPGKVISERNNDLSGSGDSLYNFAISNTPGSNVDVDQKPNFFPLMKGSFGMLDYIVVTIVVPGDSSRRAGDTVKIEFPEYGATDDVIGKINKWVSGEYLVTACRHTYNTETGYTMTLDCVKNCYEKDVDSALSAGMPDVGSVIPVTPGSTIGAGQLGNSIVPGSSLSPNLLAGQQLPEFPHD